MPFLKEIFHLVLEVFCCVLIYKSVKFIVYYWKLLSFFKSVPGPPVTPLSEDSMLQRSCHKQNYKLHKIWKLPFLPFVRVYHPDTIRPLLMKEGLRNSSYLGVYHRLTLSYNTLVACDDQVLAKEQRRIMHPFFNRKALTRYEIEINNATEKLVNKIEKKLQMKKRCHVNLLPLLTRILVEIHLKIFLSFDTEKHPRNIEEYILAKQELMKLRNIRNKKWYLYPDFVYYLTPNGIKDFFLVRRIRSLVTIWLQSKPQSQDTGDRYDVMDELMNQSFKHIFDNTIAMVGSIRNVVSATLMVLFYLAKYPLYQKYVRDEVKTLFDGNKIRTNIMHESFPKLLNTMMFLKEVLRMHPPADYTERQITEDVEVDGIIFPKWTYFHIDIYGLHHNEALWDKPEEFRPERFADAYKPQSTDGLMFLPFMAYSRGCIAKQLAIEEIVIVVARILQRYEIECDEHFVMSADKIKQIPEDGVRLCFKSISDE